jgi:hypothetical protein
MISGLSITLLLIIIVFLFLLFTQIKIFQKISSIYKHIFSFWQSAGYTIAYSFCTQITAWISLLIIGYLLPDSPIIMSVLNLGFIVILSAFFLKQLIFKIIRKEEFSFGHCFKITTITLILNIIIILLMVCIYIAALRFL